MTPHINSKKEDIAKIVIMVGNPLRAKYISENYLTDYKLVNDVRGMLAYTGYYKEKMITIFSHGMGIPSIGIYSYELYNFYDVETIIRIGTAGTYSDKINLKDLVLVRESYSNSNYAYDLYKENEKILYPDKKITNLIGELAKKNQIDILETRIHCTEIFYTKEPIYKKMQEEFKCDAVEMETFGLFANAKFLNKKAATILTITDSLVTGEELSSDERENSVDKMVKLALETVLLL